MDLCQLSREIFENKATLLDFLNNAKDQHHFHFNHCRKCGVLFEEKMSEVLNDDDIQLAFNDSYEASLFDVEGQLLDTRDTTQTKLTLEPLYLFYRATQSFVIYKSSLPSAAGSIDELRNIPSEILKDAGFEYEISIICRRYSKGYEIYVQGDKVTQLNLAFYKNDALLLEVKINEQLPEELIDEKQIHGWTHIVVKDEK